mgnify:CR=1 FL=1
MSVPTIGLLGGHAIDEIPASHRDLVGCPPVAAVATVRPDGGQLVKASTIRGGVLLGTLLSALSAMAIVYVLGIRSRSSTVREAARRFHHAAHTG